MTIRRYAMMAAALALTLGGPGLAEAGPKFEVTITNLTYHQTFSPPLVVSHDPSVAVATPGAEVSPEVVAVAEDGMAAPLKAALEGAPGVFDVQAADLPIPPGKSQS